MTKMSEPLNEGALARPKAFLKCDIYSIESTWHILDDAYDLASVYHLNTGRACIQRYPQGA